MLKKLFIFFIITIFTQSCSLFTDSVEVVCKLNGNISKQVFIKNGDYLVLEKFPTQNKSELVIKVDSNSIIISQIFPNVPKHVISGEGVLITIANDDYLIKDKFTIKEPKDYLVSLLNNEEGIDYLIVENKLEIN